jgi:hypothetical protein
MSFGHTQHFKKINCVTPTLPSWRGTIAGGWTFPVGCGAAPDGVRPAVITATTILDTPHVEANRLRRVSRMPETPKRYALWEGRSVVGREIPKE